MTAAPSEQQILALADRTLALAGPAAQVTASWELRLGTHPEPHAAEGVAVEIVCLDTGVGRARATGTDDAGLRAAAEEARRQAAAADAEPRLGELPDPIPGRGHDGWDPAALRADATEAARELSALTGGVDGVWRAGAARTGIVSTTGVRSFEQRSFATATVSSTADGRTVADTVAAVGPGRLDLDAALSRIASLSSDRSPIAAEGGQPPVVLGPLAVAAVLELVRPHFGALAVTGDGAVAGSLGRRVVAPCINLSDSPRFPGTLPRSYDAEGLPRQPLPLVQDGVAHRVVRDTASPGGASTGHATVVLQPAPAALHLVLVGGGAAEEDELMRPLRRGVFIPALSPDGRRASGAFAIEDGARAHPLTDADVHVDGLAVLASAQALTMGQRLIPTADASARTIGASMCPALRAGGGVTIRG